MMRDALTAAVVGEVGNDRGTHRLQVEVIPWRGSRSVPTGPLRNGNGNDHEAALGSGEVPPCLERFPELGFWW